MYPWIPWDLYSTLWEPLLRMKVTLFKMGRNHLPNNTVLHPWRLESSTTTLSQPQIWQKQSCLCVCHEGIWGNGSILSLILNPGILCSWPVSFLSQLHYPWGKVTGTHLTGGWLSPTASMDATEMKQNSYPSPESNHNCLGVQSKA